MPPYTFHISVLGKAPDDTDPFGFLSVPGSAAIVLCSGSGSWGNGVVAAGAAAKPMLEALIADHAGAPQFQLAFETGARIAAEHSDSDFGADFSAVVATFTNDTAEFAWAGHSGALLVRDEHVVMRTRASTLANELIKRGTITSEEALTRYRQYQNIATTSIAGHAPPQFERATWPIRDGDVFYFGTHLDHRVPSDVIDDVLLWERFTHTVLITVDVGVRET